jgi:hypothetical protein
MTGIGCLENTSIHKLKILTLQKPQMQWNKENIVKHIVKPTSDQPQIQARGLSLKRLTWASVLVTSLACLFSSCNTLNSNSNENAAALPNPVIDTENPQSLLDNVPNINREKLVKVLRAGTDHFLVVGFDDNNAVGANNTAFIRRYFVTATGLGLDTTFGVNGQITVDLMGTFEDDVHDAVLFQEPGNPVQQVVLVGSGVFLNQNQRRSVLTHVNLTTFQALPTFLNQLPNEEPTVVNVSSQNPPRVVVGLQRTTGNVFRVMRLVKVPLTQQFVLDTTFLGTGIQDITTFAPNTLGVSSVKLTDLKVAPNNTIVISGTARIITPGGGVGNLNGKGFVCGIAFLCAANLPLEQANAITIDGNNRVLVAGQNSGNLAVARLTNPQTLALDTTFGASAGTFNLNLGFNSTCFVSSPPFLTEQCTGIDVALDSQGRIVVAGNASLTMIIARFTANGQQLDNTFSQDGQLIFTENTQLTSIAAETSSLVLFNQNRIVVGGTARSLGLGVISSTLSIQRLVAP